MGFHCPKDVALVHSVFADAADSRDEDYYFELMPADSSAFIKMLTTKEGLIPFEYHPNMFYDPNRPNWFAPESPTSSYELWISSKYHGCLVIRDKKTERVFVAAPKVFD
jgi:hypothetical protein